MAGKKPTSKNTSETKLIRELAEILNETELSEIEMKRGDLKIRVSKHSQTVSTLAAPAAMLAPQAAPQPAAATMPMPSAAESTPNDHSSHPGAVKSPMVGTAYVRPSPDAAPFVKSGDNVSEGDTILLVEAMKTFNPITAPKSGKVSAVLVNDAQPVEFGEVLFIIE